MTKFEEDLNKKMDLKEVPMYFTQSGCSITRKTYIETNWIFANYGNYHSDEEFHELSEKLDDTNDALVIAQNSRDEFEREYKKLKSQLQQQALPVVKDFVAEWYEGHKDNLDFEIYHFCCDLFKTKSEFATWFGNQENNSISTLIKMKDGYTVEKPQLFYLKNKLTGLYLACDAEGYLETGRTVAEKFTQQEIDSMHAESYEKIEVTE